MTQSEFTVHGPFKMPLQRRGSKASVVADDFWRTSKELRGLASQRGCYVFGVKSGKARTPHYVGLTERRFDREVLNPSNLKKYTRAIGTARLRQAFLYFIVHPSMARSATRETRTAINEAEHFLI